MAAEGRKRITIADIARESGYSKTAVSFAFNAPERISRTAASTILETARKLNYIPDQRARNFSLGRQMTLGFLLPQDIDKCLANPYIVDVVRGMGTICQEHGYMLTLIPPVDDSAYEAVKRSTVDGLVTLGYMVRDGVDSLVNQMALPLVMIDGGDKSSFLSVNIDDEEAGFTQLDEVFSRGHSKVAIVSLPAPALTSLTQDDDGIVGRRLAGYCRAIEKYGIDEDEISLFTDVGTTYEEGYRTAERIARSGCTCVVTMSDIQAYGLIDCLLSKGIGIPEDISVVGFDNIQPLRGDRRLATIDQPAYEKGRIAAVTMFELLAGRKVDSAPMVPFTFIKGDTLSGVKKRQGVN